MKTLFAATSIYLTMAIPLSYIFERFADSTISIIHGSGINKFVSIDGQKYHLPIHVLSILLAKKGNISINIQQLPDEEIISMPLNDFVVDDSATILDLTNFDYSNHLLKSSFEVLSDLASKRTSDAPASPFILDAFSPELHEAPESCRAITDKKCEPYSIIPQVPTMNRTCSRLTLDSVAEKARGNQGPEFFKDYASQEKAPGCAGASSKTQDYVFAMVENYSCDHIKFFVASLRSTGSNAAVYLMRSDAYLNPCKDELAVCGNVTFIPVDSFQSVRPAMRRYLLILKWMLENWHKIDSCSKFLSTDARDVLFQADPFRFFDGIDADIVLSDEGYPHEIRKALFNVSRMTVSNEPHNRHAVSKTMYIATKQSCSIESFDGMPIINAGVTMGTKIGFATFIRAQAKVVASNLIRWPYIHDQSSAIVGYYYGMMNSVKVVIMPSIVSFIAHAGFYIPNLRNPKLPYHVNQNPFVNIMNYPYAVVHMIDRQWIADIIRDWLDQAKNLLIAAKSKNSCVIL